MSLNLQSRSLRLRVLVLALGCLSASTSWAAESEAKRIAELEKKLEQSNQIIRQLALRLGELEKTVASKEPAPAAAAAVAAEPAAGNAQAERMDALERNVAQITEASARAPANAGLPLHGFADVGYAHSNKTVADGHQSGFVLGNVDFYLTPEFGDRVKTLIELNFEYGDTGTLGTDLERMQIGYTFNDSATLWAGRFHTPYGYWSTAFHHGAQIQTSIDRPRMVAFEDQGGILPAHSVGMWLTGQNRVGDGKIAYDLYVANGGRIQNDGGVPGNGTLDFNAVKDDNNSALLGASVRYRFGGAMDGLVLGAHAFAHDVPSYNGAVLDSNTRVRMWGGYAFYDADQWEVISEYYKFNNEELSFGTGAHSSWAGFLQVGRTVGYALTPYVRVERASLDQTDRYFASLASGHSYSRQVMGLRYDLNPKSAIKLEFNRTDETPDGGESYNEAKLQFSVRF